MPPFLLNLPGLLMKFVTGIISPVAKAIKYLVLYKLVKGRIKGQMAEKVSKIKDEQLEIKAGPSKSRDELLDRMRDDK